MYEEIEKGVVEALCSMESMYIRFTDESNALDYLERAFEFIRRIDVDPHIWKWVVLSLHGALYGFAIAACKGTDYEIVIRRDKYGRAKLISLDAALRMCKDAEWMGTIIGGMPLKLSESQARSIRILKQTLRNNFEHYFPRIWVIDTSGMFKMAIDVLEVIKFLAVGTVRYQHLSRDQRSHIGALIEQSIHVLNRDKF